MSNKIDEATLKEPDAVEKILLTFVEKVKNNFKPIVGVVGGAFLVMAGYQALNYRQSLKNEEASEALVKVLEAYPKSDPMSAPPTGDAPRSFESFLPQVDAFIQSHSGSPVAGVALLYKGRALAANQKLAEASDAYKEAALKIAPGFKALALEGQANIAMNQQQYTVAEPLWKSLSIDATNPLQELHTMQLGLCFEAQSKLAEAKKVYEDFEKNFPKSELLPKVKLKLASLS